MEYPESMLGAVFDGKFEITYDDAGCAFIDRDGEMFRAGRLLIPKEFNDLTYSSPKQIFIKFDPLPKVWWSKKETLMEELQLLNYILIRNSVGSGTILIITRRTIIDPCYKENSKSDWQKRYDRKVHKWKYKGKNSSNVVAEEILFEEPYEIRHRLIQGGWEYKGRSVTTYPVRRKNSQTYGERVSQETLVKTIDK